MCLSSHRLKGSDVPGTRSGRSLLFIFIHQHFCATFCRERESMHAHCVLLCVTPWTVAHQASLSMGYPRQEYWSGLPFLSPGDFPNLETEPHWQADSLSPMPPGNPQIVS